MEIAMLESEGYDVAIRMDQKIIEALICGKLIYQGTLVGQRG